MNKVTAAWLAGVFDGEGCINSRSKAPLIRLEIVGQSRELLQAVASVMDAKIKPRSRHKLERRTTYVVTVNRQAQVRRLLVAMLPYLIEKRAQAELAILATGGLDKERRMELCHAISELKRLGWSDTDRTTESGTAGTRGGSASNA